MPEKTLKESTFAKASEEALTALEEKIKELEKEIEGAEGDIAHAVSTVQDAITMWGNLQKMYVMDETQYVGVHDTLVKASDTLQRARDALRWKPIDENTPYDTILLFMSHDGNVRQDFIYDEGLERAQRQYIGWMEIPAYTPEEK